MDKVAMVGFTVLALLAIASGAAVTQSTLTTAMVKEGCLHDGKLYKEGEKVNKNPCSPCYCRGETMACMIIDCMAPNCVDSVRHGCCSSCPNGANCYLPDKSILKDGDVRTFDDGSTCRCVSRFAMGYGPANPQAVCTPTSKIIQ
ncbi:hypothetical protein SNE40_000320 [Patella caerulea]|uniref:VWFC domain-containing protein n=1 Tax=Patella caerulea TaxID=87958 RepID=A0AAN8KGS3_PATCE